MPDEQIQTGQGSAQPVQAQPLEVPPQMVDLRTEKPVIDEKGEVFATSKDSKIEVEGGKIVSNVPNSVVNTADVVTDPVARMMQGISTNMPKVRNSLF